MTIFDNLYNIYELQKTLRFELKPVGATKEIIDKIKDNPYDSIFANDQKRHDDYLAAKEMIDNYYRFFIDKVLINMRFEKEDLGTAFDLYLIKDKDKNQKKEYDSIMNKLMRHVSSEFTSALNLNGLKEYKKLFGDEKKPLNMWIEKNLGVIGGLTNEEAQKLRNLTKLYGKGFIGYFNSYKTARDNMFAAENNSSSIAHRIIIDNLQTFFENLSLIRIIKEQYDDLFLKLKEQSSFFGLDSYHKYITQKGIDEYNAIIGGDNLNENQGFNQKINLYRQAKGLKSKDLPLFIPLYKQILSDRTNVYFADFSTDEELLLAITNQYDSYFKKLSKLESICKDFFIEENEDALYITTKSINSLSQELFGEWAVFRNAINESLSSLSKKNQKEYEDYISLGDLHKFYKKYNDVLDNKNIDISLTQYFTKTFIQELQCRYGACADIFENKTITICMKISERESKQVRDEDKIKRLKDLLDYMVEIKQFYRPLLLVKRNKILEPPNLNGAFYKAFEEAYEGLNAIEILYNKVRNYTTSADDLKIEKIRQYFDCSSLLTSWGQKFENNECLLFYKDNDYYFVKLLCRIPEKDLKNLFEVKESTAGYIKYYKQKLDFKNFPRLYIRSTGSIISSNVSKLNLPIDNILELYDKKEYTTTYRSINPKKYQQSLAKLIDYFKLALSRDEKYSQCNFFFRETSLYNSVDEFYDDALRGAYWLKKIPINFDVLLKMAETNQILIFQIYNKDFSKFSKGKPNLHTLYWKALFDDSNLAKMGKMDSFIAKLNGDAQIYHRKTYVPYNETHPKNEPIKNKRVINGKETSVFSYPLVKDKKYTDDKTLFHCPITLNFGAFSRDKNPKSFNNIVNHCITNDGSINYIGIDRGERHLLYYSVIDKNGMILEQGSLNELDEQVDSFSWKVDYNTLLSDIESKRMEARKNWKQIGQIKDTKSGYLSHVMHKLINLMFKYNALLIMENLNSSFKNSRVKIEKQVYQNFEKALISKLNHLVLKDRQIDEVGGVLKGYQLTYPIQTLDKVFLQNGVILYVDPSYTSKIDPTTGFVSLIHFKYENMEKAVAEIERLDSFKYVKDKHYFEISVDYLKYKDIEILKTKWIVCSHDSERYYFNKKTMKQEKVDVTSELIALFNNYGIDYQEGNDLKQRIISLFNPDGYKKLFWLLNVLLGLRYEASTGHSNQDDFILSPVQNKYGVFFDSRKNNASLPCNGDANGAYNIALKGLLTIKKMTNHELKSVGRIEWINAIQDAKWNK